MFQDLKDLFVFLIPHFIEEYVAFDYANHSQFSVDAFPMGPVAMFKPSDRFPIMARNNCITWLGFCFFNRFSEFETYNYAKGVKLCGR